MGYQTIERELTLRRNENQDLGNLLMESESVMLQEAVVTGRAAQVIVRKDTIMYNPEAFRTPEGSPIEELIKRIPGAEVDEEGVITINGKEVKKILLDGKEFMLGDVETALKNIPVSIIQNMKFYDQQSDQARITGIEDGEKETVLDFSIKKGMNRGYMTNLDLGGGTKHRYASRGMVSSFTDKTRIVLLGNFNNKEENAGWWNRRGLNSRKMLGTNLNYDDGDKLKLDASIRWNHRGGDNQTETAVQNFYSETLRTFSNKNEANYTRSNNWWGNIRAEWKPDSLTNILLRANGSYGTNDATNQSVSASFSDDPYLYVSDPLASIDPEGPLGPYLVNHNLTAGLTYGETKNAWGMLQLYRRLNPRGRNIVVKVEASGGSTQNENVSDNEVYLFLVKNQAGEDSTYYTARYNTTPGSSSGYVLSSTYSEPPPAVQLRAALQPEQERPPDLRLQPPGPQPLCWHRARIPPMGPLALDALCRHGRLSRQEPEPILRIQELHPQLPSHPAPSRGEIRLQRRIPRTAPALELHPGLPGHLRGHHPQRRQPHAHPQLPLQVQRPEQSLDPLLG